MCINTYKIIIHKIHYYSDNGMVLCYSNLYLQLPFCLIDSMNKLLELLLWSNIETLIRSERN